MNKINLPDKFHFFLKKRGWTLFNYQKDFIEEVQNNVFKRYLISSDTGTGKTITLFLPLLIDHLEKKKSKIIYISPLKSIISDLFENLNKIVSDLNIKIRVGKRTGDDSYIYKKKQIENPEEILLTTPESLALMITRKEVDQIFKSTTYLAIDELNEIINTKRGDQLALAISQIINVNKKIRIFASSTNIQNFKYLSNWVSFKKKTKIINNKFLKKIKVDILVLKNIPDYGHSVDHALSEIYDIMKNKKTIIFVNTRAQCEILYKNLFLAYPDLKIGIYHGSLSKNIRMETEKKFKVGDINCVVSTSSLEMGIDWKNIDKIINIGAPKSVNKIIQRTGRSNHQYNSISESLLIPTNKFEYLECVALKQLIFSKKYDRILEKNGAKDVLCQHLLLISCHSSFSEDKIYEIVKSTFPYKNLSKEDFHEILSFIHHGGYALQNCKDIKKLKKLNNGKFVIKDEHSKRNILMNAGTIIDSSNIKIKTLKGKVLGTVEESFLNSIKENDTFIFAGLTLVCLKIKNDEIIVISKTKKSEKVPVYWGGSMPLKSNLSEEILRILQDKKFSKFPHEIRKFLLKQKKMSEIPTKNKILIEKFPYQSGEYIFFHTFLGRETNQTLTNFLIDYLNEKKIFTINYILNDYSFGLFFNGKINIQKEDLIFFFKKEFNNVNFLNTALAKKIFKEIALISGLVLKNNIYTKTRKNFINCDLIFDTLMKYEPNHIILKITAEEINNYFIQSSQIYKIKNLNFFFKRLSEVSEFSKSLIMEKEKTKANEIL